MEILLGLLTLAVVVAAYAMQRHAGDGDALNDEEDAGDAD